MHTTSFVSLCFVYCPRVFTAATAKQISTVNTHARVCVSSAFCPVSMCMCVCARMDRLGHELRLALLQLFWLSSFAVMFSEPFPTTASRTP